MPALVYTLPDALLKCTTARSGQSPKERIRVAPSTLSCQRSKFEFNILFFLFEDKNMTETTRVEEVEVKVKIEAFQINNIRKKLLALGAVLEEKIKESDSYFTAPHRDFIKTKECLRVRETSGYLELTYKGPTTSSMDNRKQFWKSEINIPLRSSKKEVELLLESLNFTKVVEVVKNRERFILGRQKITFDNIKNLGWFLEIENIITNEQEREKALDENINLLKELGLNKKDIITEPYRDLVLQQGEH